MRKLLIGLFLFFISIYNTYSYDINNLIYETWKSYTSAYGVQINDDWTKAIILDRGASTLYEHSLSTPYDISTIWSALNSYYLAEATSPYWLSITNWELLVWKFWEYIYRYSFWTDFDLSTLSYNENIQAWAWHRSISADYSEDWTILVIAFDTTETRYYTLSTPFELSTASYTWSFTLDTSYISSINFSNDWLNLFYSKSTILYHKELSTAWDLTTLWTTTSIDFSPKNIHAIWFSNTWHKFYMSDASNNLIYQYYNTDLFIPEGPPELTDAYINSVDSLETGVSVSFTCEQDCEYNVWVYNDEETLLYNNVIWTLSGSLTPYIVEIEVSLQYQWQYKAIGGFYDLYDPEIEIIDIRGFTYWFDPDPNDYQVWDFTFTPFNFNRLENGFEIENLWVNPEGWVFFLNIIGPNGFETWEYISYMPRVWSDHGESDIYSTGYGSWSINQVTYPYHRWAWDYELLITYQYPWVWQEIYPFGTGAINYSIADPEWSEEESQVFVCDTNDDGYLSETEVIECTDALNWNFIENTWEFFRSIKLFFHELMKIGKVEPKEWGFNFIPTTHAELVSDKINLHLDMEQDNILTDVYSFIKWFIIFAFLIIWIMLIIVILKKD